MVRLGQDHGGRVDARDRACEAVVAQLDSAVFVDEHVCGLQVSVEHIRLVQILNGAEQVVNDVLGVLHLKVNVALDDLFEVTFSVLHHHVECVKGLRILRIEQLDQLNYEWVLQFAHQGDLSKDALAVCFVLEDVLHSLDCDFLASALLECECHFTIAARPQQPLTDVVAAHLPIVKLVLIQA